ncbi:hypothetical protein ACOSQ3_019744 [Xanthoceras sorbifolium]
MVLVNYKNGLDRILETNEAKVFHLYFFHSDHRPILIYLEAKSSGTVRRKRGLFFEPYWPAELKLSTMVGTSWSIDYDAVSTHISSLKSCIHSCTKEVKFRISSKIKKKCKYALDDLGPVFAIPNCCYCPENQTVRGELGVFA